MKPNYCLPIIRTKKDLVLDAIVQAEGYKYFEIWLDYIEDLDFDFINELLRNYPGQLIFTFRRMNLETPKMDPQKRLSIISTLDNHECLVDFDVMTQQEELSYILDHGMTIRLIASYHNYHQTPDEDKLLNIKKIMEKFNPEIMKFAATCLTIDEGLRLLILLLKLKEENKKYIIMGMGEYGTITRLYGTLLGNEVTFAPVSKAESSAPGQLTRSEMETILRILSTSH